MTHSRPVHSSRMGAGYSTKTNYMVRELMFWPTYQSGKVGKGQGLETDFNQVANDSITRSYVLGWPRSSFGFFISKNKRHIFHFHQELHSTTYSLFCFTTLCQFSVNFIIPSFQNFFIFYRTVPDVFYSLLGNWNFFPLREFCKDWSKWTSEGAMSGE